MVGKHVVRRVTERKREFATLKNFVRHRARDIAPLRSKIRTIIVGLE